MQRHTTTPSSSGGHRGNGVGMSMVELLVALLVLSVVMLSAVSLFGVSQQLATTQMASSEMQQAQRVAHQQLVRAVRTAGRGGLPSGLETGAPVNAGLAISVRTAAEAPDPPELMTPYNPALDRKTTEILGGTDVLTVRGVLGNAVWTVNPENPAHFTIDASNPLEVTGQLQVFQAPLPGTPLGNDIEPLRELAADVVRAPLILVSDRSDTIYTVVEFDPETSVLDAEPAQINFKVTGGDNTAAFLGLSPGGAFPVNLNTVGFVALLDEHRYYIRASREIVGENASRVAPRLAMARFMAGTNQFVDSRDIADNVLDLQIAYGFDLNGDGGVAEAADETLRDDDEWLFNHEDDNPVTVNVDGATTTASGTLAYVRLTTVTLTDRPQLGGYIAPMLIRVEDRLYEDPFTVDPENPTSPWNQEPESHYRKLVHQSLVDLRNLQ